MGETIEHRKETSVSFVTCCCRITFDCFLSGESTFSMCLLTRGSRPSSARPGKIVLRDAIGLAVDLDREDSSFYRHLEQIGKDISFGVVDIILVI